MRTAITLPYDLRSDPHGQLCPVPGNGPNGRLCHGSRAGGGSAGMAAAAAPAQPSLPSIPDALAESARGPDPGRTHSFQMPAPRVALLSSAMEIRSCTVFAVGGIEGGDGQNVSISRLTSRPQWRPEPQTALSPTRRPRVAERLAAHASGLPRRQRTARKAGAGG